MNKLANPKRNESRKQPSEPFYSTRGRPATWLCCSLKTEPGHSLGRKHAETHLNWDECLLQCIVRSRFGSMVQNLRQKPSKPLLCKTHGQKHLAPCSNGEMTTSQSSPKFAHFSVNTSHTSTAHGVHGGTVPLPWRSFGARRLQPTQIGTRVIGNEMFAPCAMVAWVGSRPGNVKLWSVPMATGISKFCRQIEISTVLGNYHTCFL